MALRLQSSYNRRVILLIIKFFLKSLHNMVLIKTHQHGSVLICPIVLKDVTSTDICQVVDPLNSGFPKGQLLAHYYFPLRPSILFERWLIKHVCG